MEKGMDMASALLNSTVRVIARNGLDKASVRIISADCNVPNPYIYQFFKDKDDLFVRAFEREDAALASEFENIFSSMYEATKDTQSRCRLLWIGLWSYMMENREGIQFYVQYYYSMYYRKYSQEKHLQLFLPLAEKIKGCFQAGVNVYVVLQYILDTMMNMAIKVFGGELSDSPECREHCFNLTTGAISPYMKKYEQRKCYTRRQIL